MMLKWTFQENPKKNRMKIHTCKTSCLRDCQKVANTFRKHIWDIYKTLIFNS